MKRLFHLIVAAVFATALLAGCQKYDDSDLRRQLQELREKLQSLEAWCSNSQSAIDAVAVLQEVVKNMNSVASIDPFIDADGRKFTVPRKQDEHNYLAFEAVEAGATVSMEIVGNAEARTGRAYNNVEVNC